MKSGIARIFLGTLIILIGVYVLLQYVFYIHISAFVYTPVFTVIVALFIICWAFAIFFGRGFYSSRVIISIVVLCFGIYVFLRYVFNIYIPFMIYSPVFRILIGIIIVFFGVYVICGRHYSFKKYLKHIKNEKYYYIFFKREVIDLTSIKPLEKIEKIKIDSLFSETLITINSDIPVRIKASGIFANVLAPSGDSLSLGDMDIIIGKLDEHILYLEVGAVFSDIKILYK